MTGEQNRLEYVRLFMGAFLNGFREGQEGSTNFREAIENKSQIGPEFEEAIKIVERMTSEQVEQLITAWPIAVAVSHVAAAVAQSQSEAISLLVAGLRPPAQSVNDEPSQDSN